MVSVSRVEKVGGTTTENGTKAGPKVGRGVFHVPKCGTHNSNLSSTFQNLPGYGNWVHFCPAFPHFLGLLTKADINRGHKTGVRTKAASFKCH